MSSELTTLSEKFRYVTRSIILVAKDPTEGADRIRGRAEIICDQRLRRTPSRSEFAPATEIVETLHIALGQGPCSIAAEFESEWAALAGRLSALGLPIGLGHDADLAFARALWCLVRHLGAQKVVETGVARGVTSSLVLAAFMLNGVGHLWSVDLPPVKPIWRDQSGVAVTEAQRSNWTYVRGSSRRRLPKLLAGIDSLDVFVHDSLHTQRTMRFEMDMAWGRLRPGGALVADDIEGNSSFLDFMGTRNDVGFLLAADHANKEGMFGVALKTG